MAGNVEKVEVQTTSGSKDFINPSADLSIGADVTKAMAHQPGLYSYYGEVTEAALARAERAKWKMQCKRDDLDKKYREQAQESQTKTTEGALESRINRNAEVRALQEKWMEYKHSASRLVRFLEACKQRADMLRSIGAYRRAEFEQSEMQTLQNKKRRVLSNNEGED